MSFFLTAGYPNMKQFIKILKFIDEENLADFLEIGIPFTDPVADGPIIQESSREALKKGVSLSKIFSELQNIRKDIRIPLVLMSYLNPLYKGSFKNNIKAAMTAGFNAAIIPDLSFDESEYFNIVARKIGFDMVFLISPDTPSRRIKLISSESSPFIYYVSRFGITGVRSSLSTGISERIRNVRRYSKVPVYCGFGISTPSQAEIVGKSADGVIIGSAIIKIIKENKENPFKEIKKFAISIRNKL